MDTLFSQDEIDKLPYYQIDNAKIKPITHALDFIEPQDLSHSVMKIKDKFGRCGVALKLNMNTSVFGKRVEGHCVEVIFQRYPDKQSHWVVQGSMTNGACMTPELWQLFKQIKEGQEVCCRDKMARLV